MTKENYTAQEIAFMSGLCQQNIRLKLKQGKFTNATKLGKLWIVPKADVDAFIKTREALQVKNK